MIWKSNIKKEWKFLRRQGYVEDLCENTDAFPVLTGENNDDYDDDN